MHLNLISYSTRLTFGVKMLYSAANALFLGVKTLLFGAKSLHFGVKASLFTSHQVDLIAINLLLSALYALSALGTTK